MKEKEKMWCAKKVAFSSILIVRNIASFKHKYSAKIRPTETCYIPNQQKFYEDSDELG